jgi:hypothetical protein
MPRKTIERTLTHVPAISHDQFREDEHRLS